MILGIAGLGDCRPPTGPGPSLHPITVPEKKFTDQIFFRDVVRFTSAQLWCLSKWRIDIANALWVGKAWRCRYCFKLCAREGPNGGSKASSTSTPEAPSVCMRQQPGVGGWEKKRRRLGTLGQKSWTDAEAKEAEWMATKQKAQSSIYTPPLSWSNISLRLLLISP